jgi:hypothetical protein
MFTLQLDNKPRNEQKLERNVFGNKIYEKSHNNWLQRVQAFHMHAGAFVNFFPRIESSRLLATYLRSVIQTKFLTNLFSRKDKILTIYQIFLKNSPKIN